MSDILNFFSKLLEVRKYEHLGDWAFHNRELPSNCAEGGRFDINRTPYFIPVAKALSNPKYRVVVVECGSQMSKTELCFNFIGYRHDFRAQPAMLVFPTQKFAEKISQTRFEQLLRTSPTLSMKRSLDKTVNKVSMKVVDGAPIFFNYATSATQLCSDAIATAIIDELDRMPDNVEGEGSVPELVFSRQVTYPNAKTLITSTPTLLQTSPIHKWRLSGTNLEWYIFCPNCKEPVLPCFANFRWDHNDPGLLKRAWIECLNCEHEIDDSYKSYLNIPGNGEFFYRTKDNKLLKETELEKDFDIYSVWVSGLVSPWNTMHSCARRWLEALQSGLESRKQAVLNTVFGETYEGKGERPEPVEVLGCRKNYNKGQLNTYFSDLIFLTVDVQKAGLYYCIRGWNTKSESGLIDWGFIFGDTKEQLVWEKLYNLSKKKWGKYYINYVFIDAAYRGNKVYAACRKYGRRWYPIMGTQKRRTPIGVNKVEIKRNGKRYKTGLTLFTIDDDFFKSELYERISVGKNWFVPLDVDNEYAKQVTAEELVIDGMRRKWVVKYKENHYLDCEKIQIFAATLLRVDLSASGERDIEKEIENCTVEETLSFEEQEEIEVSKNVQLFSKVENKRAPNVLEILNKNVGVDVWGM